IGLRKAYENGLYVFAALMPDEGVSLEEYAASLDGEKLIGIVTDTQRGDVRAAIPKFKAEHDTDMAALLAEAGMPLAFTTAADFSGLGHSSEPIWISRVLHRTRLELNEKGVKAVAATAVEMVTSSANLPTKTVYIHLDRPFIYMIWDTRNNIPVFIGCVNDIGE
ncbi:MAG: hypothetical protein IKM31_08615, partial [Oscillospiraceae bacterium]|nr:hypothetical protein [Oscillospiraceae bacterium]